MRIKMLENVVPAFPFLAKTGTVLFAGVEYKAKSNPHGAISGLCENDEWLGVRPGEFEFVEAPDWVREIHNGSQKADCKAQKQASQNSL